MSVSKREKKCFEKKRRKFLVHMNAIADDEWGVSSLKNRCFMYGQKSVSSYVYTIICGNLEDLADAGTMGLCGPTYMIGIWGDSRSAHRCQSPIANRDHGQKTWVDLSSDTVVGNDRAAPFISLSLCASNYWANFRGLELPTLLYPNFLLYT